MATGVVNYLELINVEIAENIFGFFFVGKINSFLQALFKFTPVNQTCQLIVCCLVT